MTKKKKSEETSVTQNESKQEEVVTVKATKVESKNEMLELLEELARAEKIGGADPNKSSERMRAGRAIVVRQNKDKSDALRNKLVGEIQKRLRLLVVSGPFASTVKDKMAKNVKTVYLNTSTMFDDVLADIARSTKKTGVFELSQYYRVVTTAKDWCTKYDLEISELNYKGPIVIKDDVHLRDLVYNTMLSLLSAEAMARLFMDDITNEVIDKKMTAKIIPVLLVGNNSDFLAAIATKMSNSGHKLFTAEKELDSSTMEKLINEME